MSFASVRAEATSVFRAATSQLGTLTTTGPRAAAAALMNPTRHPWRALLLAVWTAAVLVDAGSTWVMMSSGLFEEENPAAAFGMGEVGMEAYVLFASALSLALALVNVGRCRGLFAAAAVATLSAVSVSKLATGISNVALWVSVTAVSG